MQNLLPGNQTHECNKADCWYCEIMNRVNRDDVSFRKNGWSVNDCKFLLDNYDTMSVKQIAKELNKTVGAVTTKKYYLNSVNTGIKENNLVY